MASTQFPHPHPAQAESPWMPQRSVAKVEAQDGSGRGLRCNSRKLQVGWGHGERQEEDGAKVFQGLWLPILCHHHHRTAALTSPRKRVLLGACKGCWVGVCHWSTAPGSSCTGAVCTVSASPWCWASLKTFPAALRPLCHLTMPHWARQPCLSPQN